MRIKSAVILAASCFLLGAAPVLAQSASDVEQTAPAAAAATKAKVKARKKAPKVKSASEALIINARAEALTALTLTSEAGKAVAKLKKPLPPGKQVSLKLGKVKGCSFNVAGTFADGTEFEPTPVNLCNDKTVRFSDGPDAGAAPGSAGEAPTVEE